MKHRLPQLLQGAHRFIQRLAASSYGQRLRQRAWMLGIVLLTQLLLSFSALLYTYSQGVVSLGHLLLLVPYTLLHSGSWAIFFWVLAALPSKRWSTSVVVGGLLLLAVGLYLAEMVLFQEYHTLYNVDLALLMLSTNSREAAELFSILHGGSFVWAGVGLLLASGVGSFAGHRLVRAICLERLLRVALVEMLVGELLLLPVAYSHFSSRVIPSTYTTSFERALLSTGYGYLLSLKVEKRYAAMMHLEGLEDLTVADAPFDAPVDVVLVLGESTRRDYMHCYGYPLPNTPGIDSLVADSSVILFRNVLAPATTTNYSCQRTLTYYTNTEAQKEWYDYPNLLATLSRAGWATAWVTNQETTGIYSVSRIFSPFADIRCERHAGAAGRVDTSVAGLDDLGDAYDTALLPMLQTYDSLPDSLRQRAPRGLFEVVHLMGAHFDYAKRYPQGYARFKPADLPRKLGGEKDQVVASYVNSLYFGDHVFTEIAKRYRERPALIFFISDHGEILYDDPQNPEFYGHNPYMVTPGAVQVPFLVYMTPSLRQQYPAILEKLRAAQGRRISADLLTHTLTSLLGIHTRYNDPHLDFLSSEYDDHRKRIVTETEGASVNFD